MRGWQQHETRRTTADNLLSAVCELLNKSKALNGALPSDADSWGDDVGEQAASPLTISEGGLRPL